MVIDGNQTCGSDHSVLYTDVELQCCTPETYNNNNTELLRTLNEKMYMKG